MKLSSPGMLKVNKLLIANATIIEMECYITA